MGGGPARLTESLPVKLDELLASAAAVAENEASESVAREQALATSVEWSRHVADASATELREQIEQLGAAQAALAERLTVVLDQSLPQMAGAALAAMRSRFTARRPPAARPGAVAGPASP